MPCWSIAPVEVRPEVTLTGWQAFEVQLPGLGGQRTRHLVGCPLEDWQGQASSPVESFSPLKRAGLTRSGRAYQLSGEPGMGADAEHVWNVWKSTWKVPQEGVLDVSSEVWTLICTEAGK
jgi:hypothetical protein